MKVIITESQYQKIVFQLLDSLFGPNISYEKEKNSIEINDNDGEEIFRVYLKNGRTKGCEKDMYVIAETIDTIVKYMPLAIIKKKLFSKTILLYVNKKTGLNIDCIEFWYDTELDDTELDDEDYVPYIKKYNFNLKKNKKIKS
jgi:hypothetical protein